MTYNSREVNETKRRLSEHIAELQRTGAPHQQTLRQDIAMLLQAHGLAVERVGVLEQMLRGSTGLGVASTEGADLAQIRKMASAGEPLIDIHAKRDGKGNVIG